MESCVSVRRKEVMCGRLIWKIYMDGINGRFIWKDHE